MADEQRNEPVSGLEINLGNEVAINCNSGQFLGVLYGVSFSNGEIYLLPSAVYEADGKKMRIEKKFPTVISLGNFREGRDYSIRPLGTGFMEEAVKISRKTSSSIGFGAKLEDNPADKPN